jgi:hypothetical protein
LHPAFESGIFFRMIALIREMLHAQPFVPFFVLTSGGKRYRVATADHAGISPRGSQVNIWFDDEGGITLSGLHIVGVERESPQSASAA